jgi:hypothetical protein
VHALLNGERSHSLDEVDRPGAEAVDVAGEERVRAAPIARAALRALDVVAGDVLDREVTSVHRDHVHVMAVGMWASSRVTWVTGQTSRQSLWPELSQL